jgi:hypothetical protein
VPLRCAGVDPRPRPRPPVSLRLVGIVVIALLAWVILGSAISAARAVVAIAGYVFVAVLAYTLGKWVGRRGPPR